MKKIINLKQKATINLVPTAPYNFNANFHKPSHFPSSDNIWGKDNYWITMVWEKQKLGLKFINKEINNKPKIKLEIYSQKKLTKEFIKKLIPEIKWRFNFKQDISDFYKRFKDNKRIGKIIKKWRGMKPIAANSLYETLIIYFVLQNASVKRSVQMLENLFDYFGEKLKFDNKVLSSFWEPKDVMKAGEDVLRKLKVGYRAKFILKLSGQFANKEINEFNLRTKSGEEIKEEVLKLYGVGPASIEYLLFEDFYILGHLKTIPPWEQKIFSMLLFNKKLVPADKILKFFNEFSGYEKLVFHYIWEDAFWRRKNENIEWLEKEIRL